jgi:hypothetical protein
MSSKSMIDICLCTVTFPLLTCAMSAEFFFYIPFFSECCSSAPFTRTEQQHHIDESLHKGRGPCRRKIPPFSSSFFPDIFSCENSAGGYKKQRPVKDG